MPGNETKRRVPRHPQIYSNKRGVFRHLSRRFVQSPRIGSRCLRRRITQRDENDFGLSSMKECGLPPHSRFALLHCRVQIKCLIISRFSSTVLIPRCTDAIMAAAPSFVGEGYPLETESQDLLDLFGPLPHSTIREGG
jgi:hypothetical protein